MGIIEFIMMLNAESVPEVPIPDPDEILMGNEEIFMGDEEILMGNE